MPAPPPATGATLGAAGPAGNPLAPAAPFARSFHVQANPASARAAAPPWRNFAVGLGRAFGGALVFGLPLLMTMEMWTLGFVMDRVRLLALLLSALPLLVGLSYYGGFEETPSLRDDVRDALVAVLVGAVSSCALLALFGAVGPERTLDEIVGAVALQTVPASVGALLARSQFGGGEREKKDPPYFGELFLMAVGALFLSLNMAPTEEMVLIAYRLTPEAAVALALLSLAVIHAFVYVVEFRGQHARPEGWGFLSIFLRFTAAGYALALLMSLYMLWLFGRLDGAAPQDVALVTVVLGFPASVGAAAARLVL
jgi:putative integral membrane protein (TIGR02587 family)